MRAAGDEWSAQSAEEEVIATGSLGLIEEEHLVSVNEKLFFSRATTSPDTAVITTDEENTGSSD